jgi:hypothetical protein
MAIRLSSQQNVPPIISLAQWCALRESKSQIAGASFKKAKIRVCMTTAVTLSVPGPNRVQFVYDRGSDHDSHFY